MSDRPCRLITPDFHILEELLAERSDSNDPLAALLRSKLAAAQVVPPHDIPADVVTLFSRVRYRAGSHPPATRIVIPTASHEVLGATLAVTNPRGLALLGRAAQTSLTLGETPGESETVVIEAVVYQPQAARRQLRDLEAAALGPAGGPAR